MGTFIIRIVAVIGCSLCLCSACTAVPDEHEPAGVYPTFVDVDATSGKVTPAPPNLDAQDSGAEDSGAADTGGSTNCPGICNINPNNPACVNCP